MQNKNHISAFTMMDILTGMVVMSIVISMVFYLLTASNKQAIDYRKVRIELNDFMLMKSDLKLQVDRAESIEAVPHGFRLIREDQLLEYIQVDQFLIRKSNMTTDTLNKHLASLKLTLKEDEQSIIPLITGIDLIVDLRGQKLNCHIYKDYGIREKINRELRNGL